MLYFYYRIYQQLKKVKTNSTPALNAMILLGILQGLNVLSVYGIVNYFFHISVYRIHVVLGGTVLAVLLFFSGFIFFVGRKDEIYKQYEGESKEERKRGTIYLLLYILLSIVFFFVIGETLI